MGLTDKDIVDALEMTSEDSSGYYHIPSGEIVWISDLIDGCEELADDIENNYNDYIPLPSQFDINEYAMMRDFAEGYPDNRISSLLCRAISGRGAFRHFKDSVYDLGIEQKWFSFRAERYKAIAKAWREKNNI